MIAPQNIVSRAVLDSLGQAKANKTVEDYPGTRYFKVSGKSCVCDRLPCWRRPKTAPVRLHLNRGGVSRGHRAVILSDLIACIMAVFTTVKYDRLSKTMGIQAAVRAKQQCGPSSRITIL